MKTLVYSIHGFDKPFLEKANKGRHEFVYTELALNEQSTDLAAGFDAVALFTSDNANTKVIEQLHKLGVKFMALRSVGYDHVDVAKAKELGIKVANVPAYSPNAIAEHAVAMLMTLNRKILLSQELMQQNDFRLDQLLGFDLYQKTVGIVGTGKIGAAFARIMHGFGCKLLAYDIEENQELLGQVNIQYVSLNELCQLSDVISVCCPLNTSTQYLFNKTNFSIMKKGVVFINTARGGIVNTRDLLDAMDAGIVALAGLDVYEYEKPIFFYNHTTSKIEDALFEELRAHKNVLITGHQAFLTNEAIAGIANTTLLNLTEWQEKGVSPNEVE